ncbi:CsbD family protein [Convivina intestini]|uniref:Uncharacterized protein YjbJ (UPF0337 family) n=1 Tax=Convivina intestini TaxID=1505726 RepID=A0A2U1DFP0_9LACO|nr:hypothetical protein [Convivina intestini]PVY86490.1 uncharacterized protein YjbJ (UPF0337 family) [Convivina intestini]CAH1850030.1 hypothetical protein R077811_00007 [Convivina intestini]SDC20947.1 Uncharacterized conserved protein YjbJ, UPF0337 family [Leuconostocaceae bacterium R-53105]
MKNFLLGLSLVGNAALAYTLLKDQDSVRELRDRVDAMTDEWSGKAQQIKGAVTGNTGDKVEGSFNEAKGNVKNAAQDVQSDVKDAAKDVKEKADEALS